jgi:hypothetical protein
MAATDFTAERLDGSCPPHKHTAKIHESKTASISQLEDFELKEGKSKFL